eukprot:6834889-Prymnesium_polylepis.1
MAIDVRGRAASMPAAACQATLRPLPEFVTDCLRRALGSGRRARSAPSNRVMGELGVFCCGSS